MEFPRHENRTGEGEVVSAPDLWNGRLSRVGKATTMVGLHVFNAAHVLKLESLWIQNKMSPFQRVHSFRMGPTPS